MSCRLCGDVPVAVFGLSRGCVARPEDRVQALCWHHAMRATPLGSFEILVDLTDCEAFTQWLEEYRG